MDPGYEVAASSLRARSLQLERVAHDLAHASTTAYKPERVAFALAQKAASEAVGGAVALVGLGDMFGVAQQTRELLAQKGVRAALINPRWIKPLDGAVLEEFARRCRVGFSCYSWRYLSQRSCCQRRLRIGRCVFVSR